MEFSEFTLKIILLFLPGIVSFLIVDKLTNHKEFKLYQILIYSLLFGFFCYYFYYLLIIVWKILFKGEIYFSFFNALIDKESVLDFKEIAYVTMLSIFVGFISTAFINYKILNKFARKFKITKKFSDIDVWSYLMNSENTEWVVIRDIKNDLMYEGWIKAFSDSTEKDELFLQDVKVYKNSTAEELYMIPGLYLPVKRENLVIEFPGLEYTEFIKRPEKKE
jgi:hypothetical protein